MILLLYYIWFLSQKVLNRRAHAVNGNPAKSAVQLSDRITEVWEEEFDSDANLLWRALCIQMNEYEEETFGVIEIILHKFLNNRKVVRECADPKYQTKERLQTVDVIYAADMGDSSSPTYLGKKKLAKLYGKTQFNKAYQRRCSLAESFHSDKSRRSSLIDDSRWANHNGPYNLEEIECIASIFDDSSPYVYRDRQNRKVIYHIIHITCCYLYIGNSKFGNVKCHMNILCMCYFEVWVTDDVTGESELKFSYGLAATDLEALRSMLKKDDSFMQRWNQVSSKSYFPSAKWIEDNTLPKNVYLFRKRGEDSGANSILTPVSYNYDSAVTVVKVINHEQAKSMHPTYEQFFEDSICKYTDICTNCYFFDNHICIFEMIRGDGYAFSASVQNAQYEDIGSVWFVGHL